MAKGINHTDILAG